MDTDKIIVAKFLNTHAPEAVLIIEKLENEEISALLSEISFDLAVKALSHMNSYKAAKSMELLDIKLAVVLAERIDILLLELILRQSDDKFQQELLAKISAERSQKIRQKLKYATDAVGAFMNLKVLSLLKDITVGDAETLIRKEKALTTSEVYLTDKEGKIAGILKLHDLMMSKGTGKISSLMIKEIPVFLADDPIQPIINSLVWLDYKAVPVTDKSGLLIGSLQFEDIKKTKLKSDHEFNKQIIETGNALGELYRIGLTGLLQSAGRSDQE
jgi:Mg/Co/Ni transporter MgtE